MVNCMCVMCTNSEQRSKGLWQTTAKERTRPKPVHLRSVSRLIVGSIKRVGYRRERARGGGILVICKVILLAIALPPRSQHEPLVQHRPHPRAQRHFDSQLTSPTHCKVECEPRETSEESIPHS